VSQDPSEIILILIWCFDIFVETMIHFLLDSLIKSKKEKHLFEVEIFYNIINLYLMNACWIKVHIHIKKILLTQTF